MNQSSVWMKGCGVMSNQLIKSVRYYQCGYCMNNLRVMYRGLPRDMDPGRAFPAGVFLIEHESEGYMLLDTGYSQDIFRSGVRGFLYNKVTPTRVTAEDEIPAQLARDGIDVGQIRRVVLSHLHPDHIGGVKFFPESEIIMSADAYEVLGNARVRDLVFPALVPSWLAQNASVMPVQSLVQDADTGLVGHDVFGDGSLLLVRLPGHAAGQVGAYIPGRLLIATDASWGNDLLPYSAQLRLPTRLIQRDYETYKETATLVQGVVDRGIPVYFSHGQYDRRELL